MEAEGNLDECSPFLFSTPSPVDSASSQELCYLNEGSLQQDENGGRLQRKGCLPSSHVDFLNLVFPPTPQQSPTSLPTEDCESRENTEMLNDNLTKVIVQEQEGSDLLLMDISQHHGQNKEKESSFDVEMEDVTDTPNARQEIGKSSRKEKEKSGKVKTCFDIPPCVICTGKASGAHYGAITCEACKGFFRRYLQKKGEYKCSRGGKCEIINRNRGNCSGCRLAKCLALGMSKEKSKLGRYTLTKRTEAIKNMNILEGKVATDSLEEGNEIPVVDEKCETSKYDPESEMIGRKISQNAKDLNVSNGFSELLISELVQAMHEIKPYGKDIKTKEQIYERHLFHAERYKQKIELFGSMNTVPKEEFNKLYKEFGIDIDGRMADMKICCKDLEGIVERYCNFAKHIPGFHNLPYKDQSSLLKVARADFFIIIMNESYSKEHKIYLGQDGIGFHIEEMADKFLSRELLVDLCDVYTRWQKLQLSEEEKALIGALTLVCTDRCELENRYAVEKIQYAIADLIQSVLYAQNKSTSQLRFTKIIDTLTSMRNVSELYLKEYNIMCKDDVIVQELPMLSEFFLEEYDNIEKSDKQ
ncbi:nuclear receptor subfamily 1 group D member 1-like [Ruditapes philippinarum]|uniref:nuclear receptor subfamily 1 group D member 1-like n=1 Tax=Ruditapes philippinarum TaxID=129788 RepID=UPI00295B24D6|nr:nuclear receptor subfamily 1 group D member 1-like [Ruditapes philippinarum]